MFFRLVWIIILHKCVTNTTHLHKKLHVILMCYRNQFIRRTNRAECLILDVKNLLSTCNDFFFVDHLFYIGAEHFPNDTNQWTTGEVWQYADWHTSNPRNLTETTCVSFYSAVSKLINTFCSNNYYFLCEKEFF